MLEERIKENNTTPVARSVWGMFMFSLLFLFFVAQHFWNHTHAKLMTEQPPPGDFG